MGGAWMWLGWLVAPWGAAVGALALMPPEQPPAAARPLCLDTRPMGGIYGLPTEANPALGAEVYVRALPPSQVVVVDGCLGLPTGRASATKVGPSQVALGWDGVRRCYDGWTLTFGVMGDRGLVYSFAYPGGCWEPVEVGPLTMERLAPVGLSSEGGASAPDPRPEVRAAQAEAWARDQAEACEPLATLLDQALLDPGQGALVRRLLALADAPCLVPGAFAAASTATFAAEGATTLARLLPEPRRAEALLRLVAAGGDPGASYALARYTPIDDPLVADLSARVAAGGPDAPAAAAALRALRGR